MRVVREFPQTQRRYPSFLNAGDGLLLCVGLDSAVWHLKVGRDGLRLSRHGKFELQSQGADGARLLIRLPRKQWRGDSPAEDIVFVPRNCELFIYQDTLRIERLTQEACQTALSTKYAARRTGRRREVGKFIIEV